MDKEKMKMSQDTLYKFILEHGIKISRIAELMGATPSSVLSDFRHRKNRHGNPRYFTVENIHKLNDALHAFARELRTCLLRFGTDKMYTNKHGRTYDPGMIEPINNLGKYLNATYLMERMLGWSKNKKLMVFSGPSSKNYGNISEDDVDIINVEIMSIVGFLENVEVVPDENAHSSSSSSSSK